jgi:hypothetical protein
VTRGAALTSMWHKGAHGERSATTRPSACTKPRKPFGSSQAFTGTFVSPQEMGARLEAPLDEGCNCAWDQQETAISVIPLRCARAGLGLTPPRSSVATQSRQSSCVSPPSLFPRYKCEWRVKGGVTE